MTSKAKGKTAKPEPVALPEGGHWAIVELMGHVRMAGWLSEEEKFGSKMARIEIPSPDGSKYVTQWFGGQSVYRITPCTEETAKLVAKNGQPAPIHSWEIQSATRALGPGADGEYEDE